ncbi:MAG: PH domain-containing protein [FCB group bacterium]|nr:PH domain-containing protein [FCB group bacterium]
MEIRPDQKLVTKQWLVLFTISTLLLLLGIALQLLIPLNPQVTPHKVAIILWPILLGVIFLMWVIAAPIIILWIRNLLFIIEDDRITIHKGILTKQQQNIPYRAITDFLLHRSLYDRFLELGTIRIQTAGQSITATGYEGQLSGLVDWDTIHQQLRAKLKQLHPVGESIAVAEPQSTPAKDDELRQILNELKTIRKLLETRQ